MNILLLDDDKDNLDALQDELTGFGYNVSSYTTPEIAIKECKVFETDILITDMKMPEMDGIQVLAKIKKLCPYTGVIIITGYAQVDKAIEAINLGADGFLTKPLDIEKLIETIGKVYYKSSYELKKDEEYYKCSLENIEYLRFLEEIKKSKKSLDEINQEVDDFLKKVEGKIIA